jgi:ABC-type glycerol-3-phosphate transport system substrate-binding protein
VDYPSMDWTTDDFMATAVALTQGEGEGKQYGFVGEVYELNDLVFMAERLGAKLVDDSVDPPALSFNDPETIEAIRWYAKLTTEHQVKPVYLTDITKLAGASAAYIEREGLINDGQAAMWTTTAATSSLFGDRDGMNLGAAPLPAGSGSSGGGYSTASGYFISADTENVQACWQWITFLTGQPSATQGLPARSSVAESNEYREQIGAERADAYLASVANADRPSAFQAFSEEDWLGGALFWLGQAYGQVVDGEATVEEALDAAQQMADDYRACIIAAGDVSEDTWQGCVQEIDPTLPSFLFGTGE